MKDKTMKNHTESTKNKRNSKNRKRNNIKKDNTIKIEIRRHRGKPKNNLRPIKKHLNK